MTRTHSTEFGEPLSEQSKKLVKEVRLKIQQPIHPTFDTDFNIYRFVLASEKLYKKEKDVTEHAAKALNNHLRMRKALNLDTEKIRNYDENPMFQKRLMPRGEILEKCDKHNRLLWYIEYATITVESIAHTLKSSEACRYQFWQFEHMLRQVMKHEEKTNRLSSLRHIVDMTGYEINPFTMLFVTSGTLAYYSQLFHYENYPELITPADIVNISKWIHVPYKLARTMMPAGFTERFRLHDNNFLDSILTEVSIEDIPESLGGKNKSISFVGAEKVQPADYWQPSRHDVIETLETFHVPGRKHRFISFELREPRILSWYFKTDSDVYFGVFYEESLDSNLHKDEHINHESLEMVYPWLKLTAKLVHEHDSLQCDRVGRYYIVFCNKHSWLTRRTIELYLELKDTESNAKRLHSDGTLSPSLANL